MTTLEKLIGYSFKQSHLLTQAITHKSYFHENTSLSKGHNECLEFLGDAVFDLILSDLLMRAFPEAQEGELSKKRAALVNELMLAEVAKELTLEQQMLLGKGEILTGGKERPRLLASTIEALLGAIYLDGGFHAAFQVTEKLFAARILQMGSAEETYSRDYKTRFQELAQKLFKLTPVYELLKEEGPPHARVFKVALKVAERTVTEGQGKTKKEAEQEAARQALKEVADE